MTGEGGSASPSRRVLNGAALAVLLGTLLWLAYLWTAIPERLPLRTNLASPPTEGGKERLLILPLVMLFLYVLLSYTERTGALNLPDLGSPERNRAAAREVSAGLKFGCVTLLALGILRMLASSPAAPPGVVGSLFACVGGVGALLLVASAPPVNGRRPPRSVDGLR
ncbi:DUF1648 domain-containing protein [Deinococcus aerius]|uniref:DUF1648 domain-containing protein n=1 Tax=Deinococcus aerius TaxID=200253 RepID=A0A2I9CUJ9_9DEIO|nr:hypothetical protein [Deinococcus aerius]GBF05523.1 DUF1648 domain-containing protein [Deinococcus aerius]